MADVEFTIDQSTTTISLTAGVYLIETEVNPAVEFITIGVQGPSGTSTVETYIHNQKIGRAHV